MQIRWTHTDELRPEERAAAGERLERLNAEHDDLTEVHIVASSTRHHRHGGARVHIAGHVRGRELVAERERDDAGFALNEALDAFESEVHRERERRQDRSREAPVLPPVLGLIDRVLRDEGYGFILTDGGEQVYFHRNAVHGIPFDELQEGQRVGLNLEPGREGPQATSVRPAPPYSPSP